MKVLLVSDYGVVGGASICLHRLMQGLRERSIECIHAFTEYSSPFPQGVQYPLWIPNRHQKFADLCNVFTWSEWGKTIRDGGKTATLKYLLESFRPDVVNVHNIHGFGADSAVGILELCSREQPCVVTLHDMWHFTGRCAYSFDCLRYTTTCDRECPTATESPKLHPGKIESVFHRKRNLIEQRDITAISPSRWLAECAQAGFWNKGGVSVIPYGIPTDQFFPIDRSAAKQALGLSDTDRFLCLVAVDLKERRKGGLLMIPFLESIIAKSNLKILLAGDAEGIPDSLRNRVVPLGRMDDPRLLNLVYNACELLVHLAPVDNFPNVILESQAAGTPVIAFRVGGIPEQLIEGITGLLVERSQVESLVEAALAFVGAKTDPQEVRVSCRQFILDRFPIRRQAELYIEQFEQLLKSKKNTTGRHAQVEPEK